MSTQQPHTDAPQVDAPQVDETPTVSRTLDTAGIAEPAGLIGYGNFMFRYRNTLFPVVMVAVLLLMPPPVEPGTGLAANVTGLLVMLAGMVLRWVVVGMEYIKRGGVNKQVYADDLVTGGMFAHGRNPLYVGNLLILLGTFVVHGSLWVLLVGGGFFVLSYIAIVAAEERFLLEKFGDTYVRWCQTTPRWSIRLAGLKATFATHDFSWKRVIVKEYTTDATALVTLLAVLGYEQVVRYGWEQAAGMLGWTVGGVLLVGLLTLLIRSLKKTGNLRETSA